MVFKGIQKEDVKNIIEKSAIQSDNERLVLNQFYKYFDEDHANQNILWYGCFEDEKCMSLSVLKKLPYMGDDIILLAEIQTFIKGYGKPLIENIISRSRNIWWCADPAGGQSLVDYYRQFGPKEHLIKMSKWTNTPEYAFYKAQDEEHETIIIDNLYKADLCHFSLDNVESMSWGKRMYYSSGCGRFALYSYDEDPSIWYLSNIDVYEKFQSRGLGNILLKTAIDEAIDNGADILRLWCKKDSFVHSWYMRNGFYDLKPHNNPGYVWMQKDF